MLGILLPASDPNGEKNFHEKGKLPNEKDPNNPEEPIENISDRQVDDIHSEIF